MSLYVIPFACEYSVNKKCHFLIRQDHGSGSLREPYQVWCSPSGDEISNPGLNIIAPLCPYIAYLLLGFLFQLHILFWARALLIYLFKLLVHVVRLITS